MTHLTAMFIGTAFVGILIGMFLHWLFTDDSNASYNRGYDAGQRTRVSHSYSGDFIREYSEFKQDVDRFRRGFGRRADPFFDQ